MTNSLENKIAATRRRRLREWLDESGISNTELAQKLGTGRAYVSTLFTPSRHFGEKAARSIEEKLRLPSMYLDSEEQKLSTVMDWEHPEELPEDMFALVPRVAVEMAAGNGLIAVEEEGMPPLAFKRSWLTRKAVTSKDNLRIVGVSGDSMSPYLEDGDVVMIDMGQTDVTDGEVYAIRYGHDLRIKRLIKRFDGGLVLRSDNPRFPEEVIAPADLEHVQVLGRMIWRAG